MSKRSTVTFADLTWADLEAWAGSKIVSRGTDYQKSGYVKDLAVTCDGGLIAWVRGSDDYATSVSIEKGSLASVCTCPYDGNCKHAVAVVLEYIERMKKKVVVPSADEEDERFALLEDESFAAYDDEDEDVSDLYEASPTAPDITVALRKKSRKELERLFVTIAEDHPEIKKKLTLAPQPRKNKGYDALVKAVTKAIVVTSKEQGWRNYWKHTGHTPDYEPVRRGLLQLLDEGYADEVVRLGEKLFSRGTEQVEQSRDEGETADEIANAMPIVFKALAKCSLPDIDKLERAVDFGLSDEYGLCRGLDEFMNRSFGTKTWSDLADRLLERLKNLKPDGRERAFFRNYQRDNLSDEAIRALKNGGRADEAISLCFQEAEATGSYERLVTQLRKAGRTAEAEEWIRKGVKATRDRLPGIASSLKKILLEIRQKKRDWPFVAAFRAQEFFEGPSLQAYGDLQRESEKLKVWSEVRDSCLRFLETGDQPVGKSDWPLPDTGFEGTERALRENPPFTDILIDIAIKEGRIADVIRWYDLHRQKTKWPENHLDDEVATAVTHVYPDRAIAIWQKMAEGLIAQTNVGTYGEAMKYLKKARKALDSDGKAAEWATYLAKVTENNKRKTRLVQMLNTLSGKPILSK